MPDQDDVLVVGGGPAGSATALRLARLGHRVHLIDRATFPRDKSCAEYLSPATLRELVALHPAAACRLDRGAPIEATAVVTARGGRLRGSFGSGAAGHGRAIPREELDGMLYTAACAAGVTATTGRVPALLEDAIGVTGVAVQHADGTTSHHHARVVVGADGLRSIVARRTGMRRQGRLRRLAFTAHLAGVTGMRRTTEMHVGPAGYVGLNDLGGGLTNVSLVVPANIADGARGDATRFFFATLHAIPALRSRCADATVMREVLVTGPFHAMSRRSFGEGFLLVGDAAGFFDPFTGDGIHSALVGARLAAGTIDRALQQRGRVRAHDLARYRAQRRRAFLGTWMVERLIGYAMLTPWLFHRAVTRLDRQGNADLLIGATGHEISPWRVLNPLFLARMMI